MTDVELAVLPKLPPQWNYGFQVDKSDGFGRSFTITLNLKNSKMKSRQVQASPGDSDEEVARKFAQALEELKDEAWHGENPDSQWAVINSYRWAIAAQFLVD